MNLYQSLTRLIALGSLVATVSGCAILPGYDSEFTCESGGQGMACSSAREVYDATSGNLDDIEKSQDDVVERTSLVLAPVASQVGLSLPGVDSPKPVRTPARVMRIYIAPWISQSGALSMPSYLFTQIEPRRWSVGIPDEAAGAANHLYPLHIRGRDSGNQGADASDGT